MGVLKGGYPIYGIPIGIIMLDRPFPRPVGDIGNALTFPYPVHYEILEGILYENLTQHGTEEAIHSLIEAARRLERKGVRGILTSCGLLIRYQDVLSRALSVPVATSSLLLLPFLGVLLPDNKKIGIITADAKVLSREVLGQAGWSKMDRLVIKGTEGCTFFTKGIMDPCYPFELDVQQVREEVCTLCREMISEEPDIGTILLECTNLAPYRGDLIKNFSLPVFDITHVAHLLQGGTVV